MSVPSLWRQVDFVKLWTGQTVSQLGSVVTRTALPLVALLVLKAGPVELSFLVVARSSAVLIVGLVAGAWVDRLRRRPVLIWTDLLRALLLFSVPIAYALGTLSMGLLYVVSFLVAALGTLFNSAYSAYLPTLVGAERVMEGNSKIATSEAIAEVGGPGFAGALVQIVSAPFTILVDAVSFVVSALSLALIGTPEPARPPKTERVGVFREIAEGIAAVRRHALLFPLAASSVNDHFFGSFYAALYSLYLLNDLGLSPFLLGVVISAGGVGSLVGSLFATRMSRRLGVGPALVACAAASTVIGVLTPLAGGPLILATLMVFIPQLVGDAFQTIEWISHDTVRQTVTPDRVLGRVSATIEVLSHGVGPFGALVAAAIAEMFGVRTAIAVAWVGGALSVAILFFSPLPKLSSLVEWTPSERSA
ncbi:MAG TPA: MFS transporter [Candidatus Limnocylindria bacterium]